MANAVGPDEVGISVTLRTERAKQEAKQLDDSFKAIGANFGKYLLRGGAAGLAAVFGESANASRSNILAITSNLGRATGIGQTIEQDTARRNAWERARGLTAEMFGPAGRVAAPSEIMALFNAMLAIERREQLGRQNVEGVIDKAGAKQDLDTFFFFLRNFGKVMREIDYMVAPSLRAKDMAPPELR